MFAVGSLLMHFTCKNETYRLTHKSKTYRLTRKSDAYRLPYHPSYKGYSMVHARFELATPSV